MRLAFEPHISRSNFHGSGGREEADWLIGVVFCDTLSMYTGYVISSSSGTMAGVDGRSFVREGL